MKCPRCVDDLVVTQRQDVEIDCCPRCRGTRPDRGEPEKIIAHAFVEIPLEEAGITIIHQRTNGRRKAKTQIVVEPNV